MTPDQISHSTEKMYKKADSMFSEGLLNEEQYDRVCLLIGFWKEGQTALTKLNLELLELE